jgi:hypothetical protein
MRTNNSIIQQWYGSAPRGSVPLLTNEQFSNNRISAQRAWAIVIAISAAGNANTVIYTYTRGQFLQRRM